MPKKPNVKQASAADAVDVVAEVADATSELVVTVNLDPEGNDAGKFTGYNVSASFIEIALEPGSTTTTVLTPRTVSGNTSANGVAKLTLPDAASIQGAVTLTVRTPTGRLLASTEKSPADLKTPAALSVTPDPLPATQPTENPAFGRPTRLRGRVIDQGGRVQIAGRQVVVWAAKKANPADGDFVAVMVADTDGSGYFSGTYPLDTFTSAHAVVALEPTQSVPIHLNTDGTFPGDVILVVDAPRHLIDEKGSDCGCTSTTLTPRNPDSGDLVNSEGFSADVGQGRCVDFTRPDRTLQEFSYSYVVRTTEPNIKGLTLQEPVKVPSGLLSQLFALAAPQNTGITIKAADAEDEAVSVQAPLAVNANLLRKNVTKLDKVSTNSLVELGRTSTFQDILLGIDKAANRQPNRARLSCDNPVDWDDDPTIFQACTVAHGHILHFKQEWIADGYSMGKLLYSLPLAPGQKRQIAVLDWERRESAIRQEALDERENLVATLSRDRDIGEMVNSVLTESSRGGSSADTGGISGGLGLGFIGEGIGGLLGIGGGFSSSSSNAWQDSSRSVAANSLQTLRDRTSQAAAAMRSQRSTVIQSVSQSERVTAVTETIANYNHCHAMTVEYFEVLRHLLVRQRLVDVQECLFVPLLMSRFDRAKALRWRHTLRTVVPDRTLRAGFDALERIDNNYEGSDLPVGTYADQTLDFIEGDLTIKFQLARPKDKDDDFDPATWDWISKLIPSINAAEAYKTFLKGQQLKDRIFLEQFGPRIARAFVDLMTFSWVDNNNVEHALPVDTTLLSNFVNEAQLSVSLRMNDALPVVARKDIKFIKIREFAFPGVLLLNVLPGNSRVIIEGGRMNYRTKYSSDVLFSSSRIANDLTGTDSVRIFTPLNRQELRNPREEDKELARRLLDHLNENLERYHHAIWRRMSPDRRYMLLDGFEAPNSDGRSVASVVENTLIGIVGNCLVLPVSRGYQLDPTFKQGTVVDGQGNVVRAIDLLEHYQPNTPIEPVRVAIPTRGVYAEAVMGACNSCEVKEEERFWRWEESPIPDNPPAIQPTSTDTRTGTTPNLEAKDFPSPIVAIQQTPAAPDPTGLGAALAILGKSDLFKDITGLTGNQANALETFKQSLAAAQFFGDKASNLAIQGRMSKDIDKAMRAIGAAKEQGLLNDEQARQLTQGAIQSMIGGGPTTEPKPMTTKDVGEITNTAGANKASVKVNRPGGEQVEVDARAKNDTGGGPSPIITLPTATNSADARAFRPSAIDRSGVTEVEAQVDNVPSGATTSWSTADPAGLAIDTPGSMRTRIRGIRPGKSQMEFGVHDSGGTQLANVKLQLSVPQFVTVSEDAAAFNGALAALNVFNQKNDILQEARRTCDHLLKTSNVRTIWRMAPFNETAPAHIPAGNITTMTIKGESPAGHPGLVGQTISVGGAGGATVFNETINIFPGAFDNLTGSDDPTWLGTETAALVIQLKEQVVTNPLLAAFATKVFGRMLGETMAHEVVHSLLWNDIPPDGHNVPSVPNDLMNVGVDRSFRQRTGLEDTALTSPLNPDNFVDHGLAGIGGLQATNQGLMNARFPVPPSFV